MIGCKKEMRARSMFSGFSVSKAAKGLFIHSSLFTLTKKNQTAKLIVPNLAEEPTTRKS